MPTSDESRDMHRWVISGEVDRLRRLGLELKASRQRALISIEEAVKEFKKEMRGHE